MAPFVNHFSPSASESTSPFASTPVGSSQRAGGDGPYAIPLAFSVPGAVGFDALDFDSAALSPNVSLSDSLLATPQLTTRLQSGTVESAARIRMDGATGTLFPEQTPREGSVLPAERSAPSTPPREEEELLPMSTPRSTAKAAQARTPKSSRSAAPPSTGRTAQRASTTTSLDASSSHSSTASHAQYSMSNSSSSSGSTVTPARGSLRMVPLLSTPMTPPSPVLAVGRVSTFARSTTARMVTPSSSAKKRRV
jgi:hypothetical protein